MYVYAHQELVYAEHLVSRNLHAARCMNHRCRTTRIDLWATLRLRTFRFSKSEFPGPCQRRPTQLPCHLHAPLRFSLAAIRQYYPIMRSAQSDGQRTSDPRSAILESSMLYCVGLVSRTCCSSAISLLLLLIIISGVRVE